MSEFSGSGRWERDFSFLDKFGLETVYLTILGLAQSVSDIRKLMALLPNYCQLLRNDVIRLESFWKEEVSCCVVQNSHRSRVEMDVLSWLLDKQYPQRTKTRGYYACRLTEGARETPFVDSFAIHSKPVTVGGMVGYGTDHFRVVLFDQVFILGCYHSPKSEHLLVQVMFWESRLDETLTHKFLGLPPYFLVDARLSGCKGRRVGLGYLIPIEEVAVALAKFDSEPSVFTDALVAALVKLGLPVHHVTVGIPERTEL